MPLNTGKGRLSACREWPWQYAVREKRAETNRRNRGRLDDRGRRREQRRAAQYHGFGSVATLILSAGEFTHYIQGLFADMVLHALGIDARGGIIYPQTAQKLEDHRVAFA